MEALVQMLLSWLAVNSDYEIGTVPQPVVIELSPVELTREYYKDYPQGIPPSGIDHRIKALYSWQNEEVGTIFILASEFTEVSLSQETGFENPLFQEQLLHELVHHVQYYTGEYEAFTCANQGELAAYLYGGKFLKQQNILDPLPNRQVLAHLYSRC